MKKCLVSAILGLALAVGMTGSVLAAQPYEKIASTQEWKVLKIVNKERVSCGLQPLSMFDDLQQAAGVRADEIAYYFSHTRPDGSSCFTAVRELGIDYSYAGENIAAGYQSPAEVMTGWMNSDGHRGNILSSGFRHVGVGYTEGGAYGKNWVQSFIGGCSVKSAVVNDKGTENYARGTTIDQMNRYLIVRCSNHGVGYVPITAGMCSGYNPDKAGYQVITVKYYGKKIKIPVTIGSSKTYKKPEKVNNLVVKKVSTGAVSLQWDRQKGKGYEIWRATSKNGVYKKVKTLTSANRTTWKNKNLQAGKKYYFKVRAYKKVKNKKIYGLFSKAVVVKTK